TVCDRRHTSCAPDSPPSAAAISTRRPSQSSLEQDSVHQKNRHRPWLRQPSRADLAHANLTKPELESGWAMLQAAVPVVDIYEHGVGNHPVPVEAHLLPLGERRLPVLLVEEVQSVVIARALEEDILVCRLHALVLPDMEDVHGGPGVLRDKDIARE